MTECPSRSLKPMARPLGSVARLPLVPAAPKAVDLDDSALIHEFLAFADRQFVNVADYKGMRDILVAEALLVLQVVGILNAAAAGE